MIVLSYVKRQATSESREPNLGSVPRYISLPIITSFYRQSKSVMRNAESSTDPRLDLYFPYFSTRLAVAVDVESRNRSRVFG